MIGHILVFEIDENFGAGRGLVAMIGLGQEDPIDRLRDS